LELWLDLIWPEPDEIITRMKRLASFLLAILLAGLLFGACAAPGQVSGNTPQGQPNRYPPVIEDSSARQQAAQDAWTRFLTDWRLPETPSDAMPVIHTPRSLPAGIAGRININTKPGKFGEVEMKEALRLFIDHSRDVLSGSDKNVALGPKDLSLLSFVTEGNFYRATFRQVNYPVRIAENYGELSFVIGRTGELLQWSSSLLPDVSLPARAEIKPESIYDKLLNREFTYTTIAGRPQSFRVTQQDEIRIGELIVYPKLNGNRLEIHLAFPVTVGTSLAWTVYVDAINGEELGVKQNFAS
jgi:hypothetical protein